MKLDRVERIIIPIAIALIILLIISQCYLYYANRRLQVQIDTLRSETIIRHSEALEAMDEKVEELTHPATMNQRQIDWMMGKFVK